MQIGFIGLRRMGAGMAANLLKAGHQVAVYNRTADKARALVHACPTYDCTALGSIHNTSQW